MQERSSDNLEKQVYAEALRKATESYEELVEELSILRQLNDFFQADLSFNDVCKNLVEFITEATNVENASVMVFDPEQEELRLLAAKNFYQEKGSIFDNQTWSGKTFKLGEGIAGQVAKEHRSVLIRDTHLDERFVRADGQQVDVRSILCLPLLHGDTLHGVLNLSNSDPGVFDSKKEHVLNMVASTASVGLSRALVVEELRLLNQKLSIQNKELASLVALSGSLLSNLDLNSVLDESIKNLFAGFNVETCALFLENPASQRMELRSYETQTSDPNAKSLLESLNAKFSEEIVKSRKPLSYFIPSEEPKNEESYLSSLRACIGVPLFTGKDCFGVLMVVSANGRCFEESEVNLLISYCDQISLAIQNSVLVTRLKDNIEELRETRHKLIQSDKLALLGEMLSGVAHEINNPLAAIMGYSELVLYDESLGDQNREMLEKVVFCVERSKRIVQGLLSFARKTELEKKEVCVNEIIDKALEHRAHDMAINGVEIVRDYETDELIAIVDPNQMEQVFLNLANNAFDSITAQDRPGKLEIRTRLIENSMAQIEFIDNGQGIKAGDIEKVFEPFFTTKEVGRGTGLGLSVSYGIVKDHGGELYPDVTYKDGARFIMTLPVLRASQKSEETPQEVDNLEPSRVGGRILVVDDEEVIIDILKEFLSAEGFIVDSASDGESAYAMLKNKSYDLIIADMRMPSSLDGRGLFAKLKEETSDNAGKFIFITGDIMEEETARFLQESGRPFLHKPFSISELHKVVNRTLNELIS